tara:strand:+ start:12303 stop:13388 length:1086 start_codon:yes stop_codon:yes gene_type:complete
MGTDYLMAKRNNFKPHYCYSCFNFFDTSDEIFNEKYTELIDGIKREVKNNGIICDTFDYKKLQYYKKQRSLEEYVEFRAMDNVYDFYDNEDINKNRSFVVYIDKKSKKITYLWDHTVFDGMRFYHTLTCINPELYKRYDKHVSYVPILSEIFLLNTLIKKLIWPLKSSITFNELKNRPEICNISNMSKIKRLRSKFEGVKTISIIIGVYIKHIFNSLLTDKEYISIALLYGFIDSRFKNNTSCILLEIKKDTLENITKYIDRIIKKSIIDVSSIAYFKNYFGFIKLEDKYKKSKIDVFFTQFYTVNEFPSNHVYLTGGSERPKIPFFCHCYTSNKLINYCTAYNTNELNIDKFKNMDINHI